MSVDQWAIGQSEILPLFILINSDPFTNIPEIIVGFLRGGCSRGGGNLGTLRIPSKDWGTLQNIRED